MSGDSLPRSIKKFNANQPPAPRLINRQGYDIDEFGNTDWGEPKEDEFAELEREARLSEGAIVPLNRFQTIELIDSLDAQAAAEFWEFTYADVTLPARENGWMYAPSGELVWVEQDLDQLREYNEIKATADQGAGRLRQVLERYIDLLPAAEQEEIRAKYRLTASEAPQSDKLEM